MAEEKEHAGDFTGKIFSRNGLLLYREEDGRCWALSTRDYLGVVEEKDLEFVGNYGLVT
jgi:hypothetical protein